MLAAVVSYLRSQPAKVHAVPDHQFSRFGKALMAFAMAISPASPATRPPATSPTGPTIERQRVPSPIPRVLVHVLSYKPRVRTER